MFSYLFERFRFLSLTGKLVVVALTLYGLSWVVGALGDTHGARQLGKAGITVASVLVTGLIIRHIWRTYAGKQR